MARYEHIEGVIGGWIVVGMFDVTSVIVTVIALATSDNNLLNVAGLLWFFTFIFFCAHCAFAQNNQSRLLVELIDADRQEAITRRVSRRIGDIADDLRIRRQTETVVFDTLLYENFAVCEKWADRNGLDVVKIETKQGVHATLRPRRATIWL